MTHEHTKSESKTNKVENFFRRIHQRISSLGHKTPKLSKSATHDALPSSTDHIIADNTTSSNNNSTSPSESSHHHPETRDTQTFEKINKGVRTYMNNATTTTIATDYEHTQRIISNAHRLWHASHKHEHTTFHNVDPTVIYVAAMCIYMGTNTHPDDQDTRRVAIETFMKTAAPEYAPTCAPKR
ncbi:hypothetical protein BDW02DRAFT_635108 [Decorospora gaudefroyi]|uniref:Uncharacterized protein n=1 Tax=Decorospora gaudefroyi TaxID=184978 RepID=A0A6A5K248_9PLEO|nr:hypothetical protein BDW02DRAFT_635108 [Decorospora gaudefroyi]